MKIIFPTNICMIITKFYYSNETYKCIAYTRAEQIKYIFPIGNIPFRYVGKQSTIIQHYKLFWKEQLYILLHFEKVSMKRRRQISQKWKHLRLRNLIHHAILLLLYMLDKFLMLPSIRFIHFYIPYPITHSNPNLVNDTKIKKKKQ